MLTRIFLVWLALSAALLPSTTFAQKAARLKKTWNTVRVTDMNDSMVQPSYCTLEFDEDNMHTYLTFSQLELSQPYKLNGNQVNCGRVVFTIDSLTDSTLS